MAIAALSLAGLSRYTSTSNNVTASQRTFQSLQSAINSGNLRTAQNALTRYQSLNRGLSSSSSSSDNQLSASLTALGQAIQSGDVSASQSAFATVQNNVQSSSSTSSALALAQLGRTKALSQVQSVLSTLSGSSSGRLNIYA